MRKENTKCIPNKEERCIISMDIIVGQYNLEGFNLTCHQICLPGKSCVSGRYRREAKCKSEYNIHQDLGNIMLLIGQTKLPWLAENGWIQIRAARCQPSSSGVMLPCAWRRLHSMELYCTLTAMLCWNGLHAFMNNQASQRKSCWMYAIMVKLYQHLWWY